MEDDKQHDSQSGSNSDPTHQTPDQAPSTSNVTPFQVIKGGKAARTDVAAELLAMLDDATRDLHAGIEMFRRMIWSARDRAGLPPLPE